MTDVTYPQALDLAAGLFLLSAIGVLWRRQLAAMIRLFAVQGAALAAIIGILGIHQHKRPTSKEPFDELRPGLDHLAFGCANRAELETWEKRLNELGIAHGGIVDASYGSGLSFRDPDNIALEFFAPPG